MSTLSNEQFTLRVKRHSDLDIIMRALQANGSQTKDELDAATKHNTTWLMPRLRQWFDNVDFRTTKESIELSYVNVMPNQVQVVTSDVNFSGSGTGQQSSGGVEAGEIRWQLAPPMIESKGDNFDKPSYFDTMKKMVRLGKHISLEGAPGVGKDTAVQELAAIEGKVLVTLGGDGGFRKRDLTGSPQISNGSSYFEAGEYVTAAVNGWWVLITEINAADADALIYLNAQLAAPYIVTLAGKAYPVHPEFRLFVSYNAGLVGTKPLPQSLKDRFFPIRVPFFSEAQLSKRLLKMIDNVEFGSSSNFEKIVKFGMAMWNAHENGKLNYQVTTRRLYDACILMMEVDYTDVKQALKDAVLSVIDNKIERKAADLVLSETFRTW